jgi:glycosyltransferase involved in cell wall biosynthesis
MLTIGMPVFNADQYIEQTISSILSQTFKDFKLVISDNASTDKTGNICKNFSRLDTRIQYIRHKKNMGGPKNWNFVARQANSKYFKWASANDLNHATMLEKCISILEEDDEIILCYPRTKLINDNGEIIENYEDNMHILNSDPVSRFKRLLDSIRLNNAQYGVIRTTALLKTKLEGLYMSGDIPLMAELSLYGKYYEYPEFLYFRRVSEHASTINKDIRALRSFFNPQKKRLYFHRWKYYMDLIHRVARSNLGVIDKFNLFFNLIKQMNWERQKLWSELFSPFIRESR